MACDEGEVFSTLRRARRIWAVGAIHGEAEKLQNLHDRLGERFEHGDRLVYLGNFLGRGPDIVRTVDELLAFRRHILAVPPMRMCDIVFLRGRQEEMWQKLLQLQFAIDPAHVLTWMLRHGVRQTLEAYGGDADSAPNLAKGGSLELARWTNGLRMGIQQHPGHTELLAALRRAAFTEDGALLFVHAGIDPTRPLDAQNDAFWWGSAGFEEMDEPYAGSAKVIRGFDPGHGGVVIGRVTATVDGGAGFGGSLTAVCFDPQGEQLDRIDV